MGPRWDSPGRIHFHTHMGPRWDSPGRIHFHTHMGPKWDSPGRIHFHTHMGPKWDSPGRIHFHAHMGPKWDSPGRIHFHTHMGPKWDSPGRIHFHTHMGPKWDSPGKTDMSSTPRRAPGMRDVGARSLLTDIKRKYLGGGEGRNSSLLVSWARCPAWCSVVGSVLLWGEICGRGDFPLELTWLLTPFPQNSFRWEYKPRSSLCTHTFHRTFLMLTFMS